MTEIITVGNLPHARRLPPAEVVRARLLALLPKWDDERRHQDHRGAPWQYSELRRRIGGHHPTALFREVWDQLLYEGKALEVWTWDRSGQPHHFALTPADFSRFDWGNAIVQVRAIAPILERLGLSRLDSPF
ncbi:MAG: hypothetical protein HY689_02155 [Chloroflexi bacterium]|nr:hypothetical protein [Chloroflexota bacterium]